LRRPLTVSVRAYDRRHVAIRFGPRLCYLEFMTAELIALFEQASELPPSERAELAGLLLETLDSRSVEGVEEAWGSEIARRIAELDSGGVKPVPWEMVKAKLLGRVREA